MSVPDPRLPALVGDADTVQLRRWTPQEAQALDALVLESLDHLAPVDGVGPG